MHGLPIRVAGGAVVVAVAVAVEVRVVVGVAEVA